MPSFRRAALALVVLAAPAAAEEEKSFPRMEVEVDMGLYGIGTPAASVPGRTGTSSFLFGHIRPSLELSPDWSVRAWIHPDPAGPVEPAGAATAFRRQNAILEQLHLAWTPRGTGLELYAGKFNAPFGAGHETFPGVLAAFRAHQFYLIREQVGLGGSYALPLPDAWGEQRVAAAVFTRDTSFLANGLIVRRRCCAPGFDRFDRTTLREGGAGNNGRLDNVAVQVSGAEIPALPGLSYNLGLLSRAPGKDGTAREWGWVAGIRQDVALPAGLRLTPFAEFVRFRDADGIAGATQRFLTAGAQLSSGPWRATLSWQNERTRGQRSQDWIEASAGRELGRGFGLDLGYLNSRALGEDGRTARAHSVVARLGYRFGH